MSVLHVDLFNQPFVEVSKVLLYFKMSATIRHHCPGLSVLSAGLCGLCGEPHCSACTVNGWRSELNVSHVGRLHKTKRSCCTIGRGDDIMLSIQALRLPTLSGSRGEGGWGGVG